MRTFADRMRHAICFEVFGLIFVTYLSSLIFNTRPMEFGPLALILSLVATAWNYVYNWVFDHALLRLRGRVHKIWQERVVHALIFEFGMLVLTLPLVMWWLGYGFVEAMSMSLGLMLFYLVYIYLYNLAYDKIFPIPEILK